MVAGSIPVSIEQIEQQKENIQPLPSGRSASQLVSLSSHSISGLGAKLAPQHASFQARIAAVVAYEDGTWEEGRDGVTLEQVTQLAEDPLDIHHQYARFVIEHYPAGNSATSQLIPILEASTRRFIKDERYRNDPRYLRLWNFYAKNVDCSEDCYRFLFTRGIGDRLASLYEEYAKVLEGVGKRKEADDIYTVGIARGAIPLFRLKQNHLAFQQRMLLAPPLPAADDAATASSTSSAAPTRSILSVSARSAAPSVASTGGATKEANGRLFAVFQDGEEGSQGDKAGEWQDLGTTKSRRQENTVEATPWKGETLHMKPKAIGPGRLEVFRDEEQAETPSENPVVAAVDDVFRRSQKGPSELEALIKNPFKNYTDADLSINTSYNASFAVASTSAPSTTPRAASSQSSSDKRRKKRTDGDRTRKTERERTPKVKESPVTQEAVACDLKRVYPSEGGEFSFEELKAEQGAYQESMATWGGWEWTCVWEEEMERTGRTSYRLDTDTGRPLLYDPVTKFPLWDFLPQPQLPDEPAGPNIEEPPSEELEALDSDSDVLGLTLPKDDDEPDDPMAASQQDFPPPPAQQPSRPVASPAQYRRVSTSSTSPSMVPLRDENAPSHLRRRPPSPTMTMNTRDAKILMEDLFSHTLKLDDDSFSRERDSDGDDEPDTDDDEENDFVDPRFLPPATSQMSQFTQSTMAGASQDSVDAPFVPFSQTASQMGVDSFYASQMGSQFASQAETTASSQMDTGSTVTRAPVSMAGMIYKDDDENQVAPRPQPLRLFHDSTVPTPISSAPSGSFRPTRPPMGVQAGTTPLVGPLSAKNSQVARDGQTSKADAFFAPSNAEEISDEEPSTDEEEEDEEEREYQEPLRSEPGDGFALGRQRGGQNRFGQLFDPLTPITERTYEYTGVTTLSTSQQSRRDSAYPAPAPIEEDDEDASTEEEEEEGPYAAGDQAFVAFEPSGEDESDRSSFRQATFSSDEEQDEEELDAPAPVAELPVSISAESSASTDWRDATHKSAQFDESRSARPSGASEQSFATLPEGFTITGNQSGMSTGMLVSSSPSSAAEASRSTRRSIASSSTSDFPNPCNPFASQLIARILEVSPRSVLDDLNVRSLPTVVASRLDGLQKTAKRRENAAKSKAKHGDDELWELDLDGELYSVREKLGEGAFGAVFLVASAMVPSAEDDFNDDFDLEAEEEVTRFAVKVERPTNLWEYYILRELHARLSPRISSSVVQAHRLFAFQDESFLLLAYCDQGTLLDAVNKANESGIAPPTGGVSVGLDELVAMFFVVELLRVLDGFHQAGFVHGDLKIDNCLVRLETVPGGDRAWDTVYDPSGAGGWTHKGLKLVDFGRTIDRRAFPAEQEFLSELETDEFDCLEMRESRPWTFEPDYFGAASIAFNLLFGRFIETKEITQEDGLVRKGINQNFKRYHQAQLWAPLFDVLLNPKSAGTLPITNRLGELRGEMEQWLVDNSNKNGKSLKRLLRKIETHTMANKAR